MRAAVIVPVHADPEGLRITLTTLRDEPADVVAVVDGRHTATEQVAHELADRVVVLPVSRGSYAARNAGIDAVEASVEAVLFTDAGCLVQPGWVLAHCRALSTAELSGGAVRVTHSARPTPAEWVDACRNLRQQSYVEQGGYAATCNLAVRRSLLSGHRFDGGLASGGDREFCHRVTAVGARLTYTPAAVVEHPARATGRAVLTKARRVGRGLAALPGEVLLPRAPSRPDRALVRRAQQQGVPTPPLWALRVAWLDYRRATVLRAEARRPQPVQGLHVVVLLASRWSSLEGMNTRWRQVVLEWARHPGVASVTLVDHPHFRRSATRLVTRGTTWLPGVTLLDVTVPTTLRPGPLDRLAWRRAGRALRQGLPVAPRTLVVSTSSVSTPLLRHLRGPGVTTAFDAVDVWRNLALRGDLGSRLERGYRSVGDADRLTAVSAPIAASLDRWTARRAVVVPNGVTLAAYEGPGAPPDGLPARPLAVYVGSLSSRLDLELVGQVAALLEGEVAVVLAGPADDDTAVRIRQLPLCWLGPVDTEQVPALLRHADVGLFPHRDTELTEARDSMKLLEYAAAGLPVVATPLPGLPPGVRAAATAESFADLVRAAVRQPRDPHPAEWVRDRDWRVVADQLLAALLGDAVTEPRERVVS